MINKEFGIPESFNNKYLTYLSIMDHLNEIISIDSEWKKYKNTTIDSGDTKDTHEAVIKHHFNDELADLYLLINTYFETDNTIKRRMEKFIAKDNQNKKAQN